MDSKLARPALFGSLCPHHTACNKPPHSRPPTPALNRSPGSIRSLRDERASSWRMLGRRPDASAANAGSQCIYRLRSSFQSCLGLRLGVLLHTTHRETDQHRHKQLRHVLSHRAPLAARPWLRVFTSCLMRSSFAISSFARGNWPVLNFEWSTTPLYVISKALIDFRVCTITSKP